MNKELNQKIILDRQGMSFSTTSIEQGRILLLWEQDIDLDLMLFYKTIDDKEGGVFPNYFYLDTNTIGSLHEFPYIQYSSNLLMNYEEYKAFNLEEIKFRKIDTSISDIFILIVDIDSTQENFPVDFTNYHCQLKIQYNLECSIEIPVNSSKTGVIYLICRIKNEKGRINIINESKCISLEEACNLIPGFNMICSK